MCIQVHGWGWAEKEEGRAERNGEERRGVEKRGRHSEAWRGSSIGIGLLALW